MNTFKKIGCRVYQKGLWMALPVLPYREPKLVEGFSGIPEVLTANKVSRIMLVTDKGIRGLGLTKPLEELLVKEGFYVTVFDDTVANPTISNVEAAREQYLKENCDGIIAFGGGSSMDCAKALGARIARPKRPTEKMKGLFKVIKPLPFLLAIPTTAGTGSETTVCAVITDDKTHYKYAINDFVLIPRYAALEPDVTLGLPGGLTATTGMDAMTHAVEAYIGGSTTRKTREASVKAVKLIFENLEKAYADGQNKVARSNMLHASYVAGIAFTRSYVGYVHAVAHSLGGQYGIPHGLANSVLLPIVLEKYGEAAWKKLARLARETGLVPATMEDEEAAKKFIEKLRTMNRNMNIPEKLRGIKDEDIPGLAIKADKEANPLYPVPVLWDAKELEEIYRAVKE